MAPTRFAMAVAFASMRAWGDGFFFGVTANGLGGLGSMVRSMWSVVRDGSIWAFGTANGFAHQSHIDALFPPAIHGCQEAPSRTHRQHSTEHTSES